MPSLLLALALAASADPAGGAAFGPGEQMSYQVKWLGLPAGEAQVTVGAESPDRPGAWPIVTVARSDQVLYPMREKVVVWWDPTTHRSRELDQLAEENRKRHHRRIEFQPDAGRARVTVQQEGSPAEVKDHEVPPDAVDVASALFILRSHRLGVGDEISFPIFTGSRLFQGHAVVQEQVRLETPLGPRSTVKVRLQTEFSGKLTTREVRMWFSDDGAHVPLRMEADFALGSIVLECTDYKAGRAVRPSPVARGDAPLPGRAP